MDRDPAQEAVAVHAEVGRRAVEIGRHEQQPRRGVGAEQRQLVLPEHPLRQVARDEPHLGGQGHAGARAERAREGARGVEAAVQTLGHGVQQGRERRKVCLRPLLAAHHLGGWKSRGRLEPGVRDHGRLDLTCDRGDVHAEIGHVVRARREARYLACESPVDHQGRKLEVG